MKKKNRNMKLKYKQTVAHHLKRQPTSEEFGTRV